MSFVGLQLLSATWVPELFAAESRYRALGGVAPNPKPRKPRNEKNCTAGKNNFYQICNPKSFNTLRNIHHFPQI